MKEFFAFILLALFAAPLRAAYSNAIITNGHSHLHVEFEDGQWNLTRAQLLSWVETSARGVALYFGQFPVNDVHIRIGVSHWGEIGGGKTFSGPNGNLIVIKVGRSATVADLKADWVLTHEMVHLSFPDVDNEYNWMEEGLATYVEPFCRILAGTQTTDKMWLDLIRDMPNGQPEEADQGLNVTQTWGRIYWGGALFYFLADVEFRKRSNNHESLRDALRRIVKAGGPGDDWSAEQVLEVADGNGPPIMTELFHTYAEKATTANLTELWTQLGLRSENGRLIINDAAPLAPIRRAMTST